MSKVKLELNPGLGAKNFVLVDNYDLSSVVDSVDLTWTEGNVPSVNLRVLATKLTIENENAIVRLDGQFIPTDLAKEFYEQLDKKFGEPRDIIQIRKDMYTHMANVVEHQYADDPISKAVAQRIAQSLRMLSTDLISKQPKKLCPTCKFEPHCKQSVEMIGDDGYKSRLNLNTCSLWCQRCTIR